MNATPRYLLPLSVLLLAAAAVHGQGVFGGSNVSQRTRVGSVDGTLAGTNIFGQFLAGPTSDSLALVGMASPHFGGGGFAVPNVTVPTVPAYSFAFVQLWAWDATLWGTTMENVPLDQFGRSDIAQVLLTTGVFPDIIIAPQFNRPAIVPVPEPSVWALGLLGALALLPLLRHRRT